MLQPLGCHIYQTIVSNLFAFLLSLVFQTCFDDAFQALVLHVLHTFPRPVLAVLCFLQEFQIFDVSNKSFKERLRDVFQTFSLVVIPVCPNVFVCFCMLFRRSGSISVKQYLQALDPFAIMRSQLFQTHFCDAFQAFLLHSFHTFSFDAVPISWFLKRN